MNMYDEACEIRLAKWEDIPEIMDFVEKEWRHGHILGRDRAFFEYEHGGDIYDVFDAVRVRILRLAL